jgi:ribosome-associated translation inhibitor RaiA
MPMKNIKNSVKINFNRVTSSTTVVNYIAKRLKKPKFAKVEIDKVDCDISRRSDKGDKKFSVRMTILVNNTQIYFSEAGNDLYKMIDSILAKLQRKFAAQYQQQLNSKA